jgi:cytochrome c peroxidase
MRPIAKRTLIIAATLPGLTWLITSIGIAQNEKRYDRTLGLPPINCPPGNLTSKEKVALGQELFYSRALSGDDSRACASCHLPMVGFSDSDDVSLGVQGRHGKRHSLSILNSGCLRYFMWDGRASSLEQQVLLPLHSHDEMSMTDRAVISNLRKQGFTPKFKKAFGGDITIERIAQALACFERTLAAGDSPFDRYVFAHDNNALTAAQKHGLQVFKSAGCAQCHTLGEDQKWSMLTDYKFHNLGVGCENSQCDVGRFGVTHNPADWGAFRTPSLRNVALRPPYFHDGSASDLTAAVDFHLAGGRKNKNLDPLLKPVVLKRKDKEDLLSFLNALTSNDMTAVLNSAVPKNIPH